MNPNKLVLSLTGNDALREKMATVSPGDEIEMELTVRLDESTTEQAQFSVVEAEVMEDEGETPEPGSDLMEGGDMGEPGGEKAEEGAAVMLMFGKGGKAPESD